MLCAILLHNRVGACIGFGRRDEDVGGVHGDWPPTKMTVRAHKMVITTAIRLRFDRRSTPIRLETVALRPSTLRRYMHCSLYK